MTAPSDKTRSRFHHDPKSAGEDHVLVVWPGGSQRIALPRESSLVVGRGADCEVRIVDGSVSRTHVRLHSSASGVTIEDLGSSNGTRLGGCPLRPHQVTSLPADTVVEMGDAMLVLQASGPAAATPRLEEGGMQRLLKLAAVVASSDVNVILQGETGVGKEVMARFIHDNSPRKAAPFVKLNCAAFPEALVEAELFGYDKGAFTGANAAKPGLIESAEGGTLLLDEVAELPSVAQAKLLRAVGNLEVMRIGSVQTKAIDVRFMAAAHVPLETLIASGRFRADLYYRLNGATLNLPPLRQRLDELPELAHTFAREWAQRLARPVPAISPAGLAWLAKQAWPGNVRELKAMVERAALLGPGPLDPARFAAAAELGGATAPAASAAPAADTTGALGDLSLREDLTRIEREKIIEAMNRCGGNQTKAAQALGISRRALLNRLDAYGLPRPRKGASPS